MRWVDVTVGLAVAVAYYGLMYALAYAVYRGWFWRDEDSP